MLQTKNWQARNLTSLSKNGAGEMPYAIRSWRTNWDELISFFHFPLEIRKIIYTTNLIENLNGRIRKHTPNKLSFSTEDALKKVCLSISYIQYK